MSGFAQNAVRVAIASAVCFAAGLVVGLRAPRGVSTDLYSILAPERGDALRAIADNISGEMRVLAVAPDFDSAKDALSALGLLPPPFSAAEVAAAIAGHGAGLLSPATRKRLISGQYAAVSADSAARLFGPAPPLFSVKRDPFLLLSDWLESVQNATSPGWTLREGLPVCEKDGKFHVLSTMDRSVAPDPLVAMDAVKKFNEAHAPSVSVFCSGAPFHVALAEARSKREIGILSMLSCGVVLLLGWLLLRRVSFAIPLVAFTFAAFVVASGAVFATFDRPHVLTFVFGTSLIGLSVDYVYHALAERGEASAFLVRDLTRALVTTCACFAPFFLSHVTVLRQMALFTVAGLVTVYALTCLFLRK